MFTRRCFLFALRQRRPPLLLAAALILTSLLALIYFHNVGIPVSSNTIAELSVGKKLCGSETCGKETVDLAEIKSGSVKFVAPVDTDAKEEENRDSFNKALGEIQQSLNAVKIPQENQQVPEAPAPFQQHLLPSGSSAVQGWPNVGIARSGMEAGQAVMSYGRRRIYPSQDHIYQETMNLTLDGPPFVPERRVVHLDLKGAPPTVDYIKKIIPILKKLGATGLLLEYEDMFPFEGVLRSIRAHKHYTKDQVKEILSVAADNSLEVIPLVQTFGHLEFVLKLEQFTQLRENPNVPQALCPSRNESLSLVEILLDQVMALHPNVEYLHIGCDEVYHIGECSLCSSKTREELFLNHVTRIASYVRHKYKVMPLIWDDMMRSMPPETLKESSISRLVEPVVWVYAENVYRFAPPRTFDQYSEVFPAVWGSSAFKGAFGETYVAPNVKRHLENNQNWLIVGREEGKKFRQGFRGLLITGWQRYDHFATLCELLPSALPSLALNLVLVSNGHLNDTLATQMYDALSCSRSPKYTRLPDLDYDPFLHDKMSWCFFPGAPFFKMIPRYLRTEKMVHNYVYETTVHKGWLTQYNVRRNYTSPARVDELIKDLAFVTGSVKNIGRQVMESLKDIYDVYTVSEWMEFKLLPLLQKLKKILDEAHAVQSRKTWDQRPLKLFDRWDDFGIRLDDYYGPAAKSNDRTNDKENSAKNFGIERQA